MSTLTLFDSDKTHDLVWAERIDSRIINLIANKLANHSPFVSGLLPITLVDRFVPNNLPWAENWSTVFYEFLKPLSRTHILTNGELNGEAYGFDPEYKAELPNALNLPDFPDEITLKILKGQTVSISWLERSHSEITHGRLCAQVPQPISIWSRRGAVYSASKEEDLEIKFDSRLWLINSCVIQGNGSLIGVSNAQKELILYQYLDNTLETIYNQLNISQCQVLIRCQATLTVKYRIPNIARVAPNYNLSNPQSTPYPQLIGEKVDFSSPTFQQVASDYHFACLIYASNNVWGNSENKVNKGKKPSIFVDSQNQTFSISLSSTINTSQWLQPLISFDDLQAIDDLTISTNTVLGVDSGSPFLKNFAANPDNQTFKNIAVYRLKYFASGLPNLVISLSPLTYSQPPYYRDWSNFTYPEIYGQYFDIFIKHESTGENSQKITFYHYPRPFYVINFLPDDIDLFSNGESWLVKNALEVKTIATGENGYDQFFDRKEIVNDMAIKVSIKSDREAVLSSGIVKFERRVNHAVNTGFVYIGDLDPSVNHNIEQEFSQSVNLSREIRASALEGKNFIIVLENGEPKKNVVSDNYTNLLVNEFIENFDNDTDNGDIMPDSLLMKRLAEQVQLLSDWMGVAQQPDGTIKQFPDPYHVDKLDAPTVQGLQFSAFGKAKASDPHGAALYEVQTNRVEVDDFGKPKIKQGGFIKVFNFPQFFEQFAFDIGKGLGLQESGGIQVPKGDNSGFVVYQSQLAMQIDQLYTISRLTKTCNEILINSIRGEAQLQSLLAATGCPLTKQEIPITINGKQGNLIVGVLNPNSPSILSEIGVLKVNLAPLVAGALTVQEDN